MHLLSLNDEIPLIADTSVIINLLASGDAEQIFSGIKNPICIVEQIIDELEVGSDNGHLDQSILNTLIDNGTVQMVSLNDDGWDVFGELVCGPTPNTLDDGEAATLAYCVTNGSVPIIDEKKANRICQDQYPSLQPISSVALFKLFKKHQIVSDDFLSTAIYKSLIIGKMRVLNSHLDWVVNLIGSERAYECISLPYAARKS